MSVAIIPAPPKPKPALPPVVWDLTIDYNEAEQRFYARSDIDHRVYITTPQQIYLNPETGEMIAQ